MRSLLPILLALAVLAGPAPAQADPARRAEVLRLDGQRAELAAERRGLESELDRLAAEIAQLKARREGGTALFGDPELDRRLKRSRELSARIDALSRREEAVAEQLRPAAAALLAASDAAMAKARGELEAAQGEDARRAALEQVARLERERREVQAGLDRLNPGAAPAQLSGEAVSDDPDALRAQADRLRDNSDRLARRLGELQRRAGEVRDQRALERELAGFLSETRFFDEGDRAASRVATVAGGSAGTPTGADSVPGEVAADPSSDYDSGGGAAAPPPAEGSLEGARSGPPTGAASPGEAGEAFFRLERTPTRAEASAAIDDLFRLDDDASLDDLEDRMKEIRVLIDRLDRRAGSLEQRADALE